MPFPPYPSFPTHRESTQVRRLIAVHTGDDPRGRPDSARRAAPRAGHRRRLGLSGRHQPAARVRAARRARRRAYLEDAFEQIARRHRSAVAHLVGTRGRRRVRARRSTRCSPSSRSTLQGIHLLRHCPPRALDMTASFGERLSALIVAAYLGRTHAAAFVDARDLLVTDDQFTHANVHFPATNRRTRAYFTRLFRRAPRRRADRHRLHRRHRRRPDDDDRPQRIRLQRGDRRRRGRRLGDRDLDRRRRRAERRSARRAGGVRAAADDLRRGDGAVVLRREGAALGDDRAGGREAHPDPDQEHVQPGRAGHAHLPQGRRRWEAGEGDHVGRRPGAADAARPGHGRRARRRRARVRHARRARASTSS